MFVNIDNTSKEKRVRDPIVVSTYSEVTVANAAPLTPRPSGKINMVSSIAFTRLPATACITHPYISFSIQHFKSTAFDILNRKPNVTTKICLRNLTHSIQRCLCIHESTKCTLCCKCYDDWGSTICP